MMDLHQMRERRLRMAAERCMERYQQQQENDIIQRRVHRALVVWMVACAFAAAVGYCMAYI